MVNTEKTGYKWEVLALLWVAFLFNQADRQVFNIVLPLLREDLGLTDVGVGAIATLFNLVYALFVPIAGYVGDRYSKKWIVVASILFWSAATLSTGFATGLVMLILLRSIATGGGEAFFGPPNYSLLAQYHTKTRAFAMSIHQTSYYLGIILSGLAASYIAERWGWRYSFYIFGLLGLIHGIVMIFRLKDKPVEANNAVSQEKMPSLLDGFKIVFGTPTALILTIGFSCLIFGLTGYLTWMPTYLYENFSLSLSQAGFHSMVYTHVFAFIGVILAGKLSDKLAVKDKRYRILLQSMGLLLACPFIILMGNAQSLTWIYIGFAGFGFMRAFFDANTYSVLYDVVPARYHSSASGVMIMTGFFIGSFSPVVLGYIKPIFGLSMGFSFLAGVWIFGAIVLWVAYRFYMKRDLAKVETC
ncbi:MFS transporter [Sphingobacterium paucimobilis]|uniref:Major facilitator superfamily (MFS) profile domain-containing protein n=1 Tax=Sphingobacterium paucimobilis HER1398 TaxID=1346330 RepID=U2J8R1_9SPHI|nr:MFS transporter [Sphingobacterium paucimobilis]ERJ61329.1 hypothetical protein M472_21475 [Sphingobacterium paucimobilis HER1398]